MGRITETIKHPDFEGVASSESQAACFLFIGTFIYMLFVSDVSPGLLGGCLFFFFGVFLASLVVAMPLLYLRLLIPPLGLVIAFLKIFITIGLTRMAYLKLFS